MVLRVLLDRPYKFLVRSLMIENCISCNSKICQAVYLQKMRQRDLKFSFPENRRCFVITSGTLAERTFFFQKGVSEAFADLHTYFKVKVAGGAHLLIV